MRIPSSLEYSKNFAPSPLKHQNPKIPLKTVEDFSSLMILNPFWDPMQIFIWPIAIISENQTLDRSTFNFILNSISSGAITIVTYSNVLMQSRREGEAALAWQRWLTELPHRLRQFGLTWGQKWAFLLYASWAHGREKVTHWWSNPFLFYLNF